MKRIDKEALLRQLREDIDTVERDDLGLRQSLEKLTVECGVLPADLLRHYTEYLSLLSEWKGLYSDVAVAVENLNFEKQEDLLQLEKLRIKHEQAAVIASRLGAAGRLVVNGLATVTKMAKAKAAKTMH